MNSQIIKPSYLTARMNELVMEYLKDGWLLTGSNSSYSDAGQREILFKEDKCVAITIYRRGSPFEFDEHYSIQIRPMRNGFISNSEASVMEERYYIVGNTSRKHWCLTTDIEVAKKAYKTRTNRPARLCSPGNSTSTVPLTAKMKDAILAKAREHRGFTNCKAKQISDLTISRFVYLGTTIRNVNFRVTVISASGNDELNFLWTNSHKEIYQKNHKTGKITRISYQKYN